METPILILEDALLQQKKQICRLEIDSLDVRSENQLIMYQKAIDNLKGFIVEIETALKILKWKDTTVGGGTKPEGINP